MEKYDDKFSLEDIELEYKLIRKSGGKINIDDFLDEYELDSTNRLRIKQRLQRWEKSVSGSEEYRKTFDFDAVFRKILNRISQETTNSDDLWERAIHILKSVSGDLFKLEFGSLYERKKAAAAGTLSAGKHIVSSNERAEVYRLTTGPLAGTEVRLEGDRLLIDLKQRPPEGSQLRLMDRNGQIVKLPVIYELDATGSIIYDLSGVSDLPPFEIQLITEED